MSTSPKIKFDKSVVFLSLSFSYFEIIFLLMMFYVVCHRLFAYIVINYTTWTFLLFKNKLQINESKYNKLQQRMI